MNSLTLRRRLVLGFTLIEVLIALAITSMVVSVLMSSVFYGAKVQSAIREELVDREKSLQTQVWFSEMLGSCLPADSTSGASFSGSARDISCDSVMPLQGRKNTAAQRIHLRLSSNDQQVQQLVYLQDALSTRSQVIVNLPSGTAAFTFFGVDGQEVEKWPLAANDAETLPRRIRLAVKSTTGTHIDFDWLVSVRASPWLEPVLTNPFGIGSSS